MPRRGSQPCRLLPATLGPLAAPPSNLDSRHRGRSSSGTTSSTSRLGCGWAGRLLGCSCCCPVAGGLSALGLGLAAAVAAEVALGGRLDVSCIGVAACVAVGWLGDLAAVAAAAAASALHWSGGATDSRAQQFEFVSESVRVMRGHAAATQQQLLPLRCNIARWHGRAGA